MRWKEAFGCPPPPAVDHLQNLREFVPFPTRKTKTAFQGVGLGEGVMKETIRIVHELAQGI